MSDTNCNKANSLFHKLVFGLQKPVLNMAKSKYKDKSKAHLTSLLVFEIGYNIRAIIKMAAIVLCIGSKISGENIDEFKEMTMEEMIKSPLFNEIDEEELDSEVLDALSEAPKEILKNVD
jgi:hypothetical protein